MSPGQDGSTNTPLQQPGYTVTVISRPNTTPIVTVYRTRSAAMRSANGIRATLAPQQGGQVSVYDPNGAELQSWVEQPEGGRFMRPGDFGMCLAHCPAVE